MPTNARAIEFSRDEEEGCVHSRKSRVASGLAFGGQEEAVEHFGEAVGLVALCPSDDAGEVLLEPAGDIIPRRDLRLQDVGAPLI